MNQKQLVLNLENSLINSDYIIKDRFIYLTPSVESALRKVKLKKKQKHKYDALLELDDQGIITYISRPIESFLGYRPSEIIGHPFYKFIYPEDLHIVQKEFYNKSLGYSTPVEFRLVKKTGGVIWVRSSIRYTIQENRITGVRRLFGNMTESKKYDENHKESIERLKKATRVIIQSMAYRTDNYTTS